MRVEKKQKTFAYRNYRDFTKQWATSKTRDFNEGNNKQCATSSMWNISLCGHSTCCNKGPLSSSSHVACFYFWCPHTSSVHEGGLLLTRHLHIRIKLKTKVHTAYGRNCWLLKYQHIFFLELLTCSEKKEYY